MDALRKRNVYNLKVNERHELAKLMDAASGKFMEKSSFYHSKVNLLKKWRDRKKIPGRSERAFVCHFQWCGCCCCRFCGCLSVHVCSRSVREMKKSYVHFLLFRFFFAIWLRTISLWIEITLCCSHWKWPIFLRRNIPIFLRDFNFIKFIWIRFP